MDKIITQVIQQFIENIYEISWNEMSLDKMTTNMLKECQTAACHMAEAVIAERNKLLRQDKDWRRKKRLVMKQHNCPRSQLTPIGMVEYQRDCYLDKTTGHYTYILDQMMGVRKNARLSDTIRADLISTAVDQSYAKSAKIVTGGKVSRQTVHDQIIKAPILEKMPDTEKRSVSELHVYADEDHVHMQKSGKVRGKRNRIVPLVVVTEGTKSVGVGRNRTVAPMRFVDEKFDTKALWEAVDGYIMKTYKQEAIEKIYLHGDGGRWIKTGLDSYPQTTRMMDRYHFENELKSLDKLFPSKLIHETIEHAIIRDGKRHADEYLQGLIKCAEDEVTEKKVERFGTYMIGNWESIRNCLTIQGPGSCTEGQVSHTLSERFSRNPMGWSDKGLGKLSKARVYKLNGGLIDASIYDENKRSDSYMQYAKKMLTQHEKLDWSMFEAEIPIMDGNSVTQQYIRHIGINHGIIN